MKEIYIFGSLTSGAFDPGSDVDILVVTDNQEVITQCPRSWSVYSSERIKELYSRGTLFSWHLYNDSVQIYPRNQVGCLNLLGPPVPYSNAKVEIAYLFSLVTNAISELKAGTPSWIFEFGLVHVGIRDIAMAAAYPILHKFNFSRFAPFDLPVDGFPLSMDEYKFLMTCRRSSVRGSAPPLDARLPASIMGKLDAVESWLRKVQWRIENGNVS